MANKVLAHFSPGKIIFASIALTIIGGALALALPIARTESIPFVDLLFTATSATCVTGLETVPLNSFTTVGHAIILALVQIGGLGLITLTTFLMSLFLNFGFATQLMAGKLLELESWTNIKRFLLFVVGITLTAEILGALSFFFVLRTQMPLDQAWFYAVFHSVCSFCNAGISLFGNDFENFINAPSMLITSSLLMVFGGLGFVTWREILNYIGSLSRRKRYTFSLHSRLVLLGTFFLVVGPALVIFLLEYKGAFAHLSLGHKIINSFFHTTAFRGGGFASVPIGALHSATLLIAMVLGFIGNAPGSTGSGIKITVLAIFLATIKASVAGKTSVDMQGRRINKDQIYKALAIVSLSVAWVLLSTFFLLIFESGTAFLALFFEAISAFATMGLSLGITPLLSVFGKFIIIASMIVGRIGSLTLILALRGLTNRKKSEGSEFSYPEERVILS